MDSGAASAHDRPGGRCRAAPRLRQRLQLYHAAATRPCGAGIKIFPIGASGLDDQGEYIFRQFAEVTQGQFVFLTYANGVSGAPGLATDKHVSDFTVDQLDSLVVNLVAGEIANQTGQPSQAQMPPTMPVVGDVITATPLATSPLLTLAQQVSRFAEESNLGLWLVVVLAGVWWVRQARQAPGRARRERALPARRLRGLGRSTRGWTARRQTARRCAPPRSWPLRPIRRRNW